MGKLYNVLIAAAILCSPILARAQGLSVNTSGSAADSSAMLDVASTTKGMLVPRMTLTQRTSISSPATGLLVFQTDGTAGFYYNSGTSASPVWVSLNALSNVTTQGNSTTGSGNIVLSTSPTLVTPNLGTIASGNASNLTNIPAANITGNLSVNNLNSGTSASSSTFWRGDGTWASAPGIPNGSAAGQILITGSSPFSPAYQSVSGDISLTSSGVASIAGNTTSGNDITAAIVNFATSNKTGSGSVVLASSPTLVAPTLSSPALGTIASGNGAALTSLNASNISSGTLAAGRGGAGSVNGLLKADGSGNVSQAVAGTDYQAPITLTTTGAGAATFTSGTLNIPTPISYSVITSGPVSAVASKAYIINANSITVNLPSTTSLAAGSTITILLSSLSISSCTVHLSAAGFTTSALSTSTYTSGTNLVSGADWIGEIVCIYTGSNWAINIGE